LIYAAIIALWAAVLIPIWLKRHDQVSEVRSTARFSSAMKSLGSRESSNNRNENHGGTYMPRSQASAIASKRRAMVLALLTGLLFISLVGTLFAAVPMAVTIVFATLLGAFVLASALTASSRSRSAVSPRLEEREYFEADVEIEESAPPVRMSARERAISQKSELDAFAEWDPWEEDDSSWDAVPQTLPKYVSSPRATAVPRNIERNGDWSGEAMVEAARGMRRPAMRADDLVRNPIANSAADTAEIPIIRANAPYQARAVNE
jgi:hypothetical protein